MGHYANEWDDPAYWAALEEEQNRRDYEAIREAEYWEGRFLEEVATLVETLTCLQVARCGS